MVTDNFLERLMANKMLLAIEHAEDLKWQIEHALERFGKRDSYDVTMVEQKNGGYRVRTVKKKENAPKADPNAKSGSSKIIKLRRAG